jgi:enoyl-CoA hydratase/carnithine racemase
VSEAGELETLRVVFSRPPINLFDPTMQRELELSFTELEDDPEIPVVIFESDVPGYFLAHYDVAAILAEEESHPRAAPGSFNRLMERIASSEMATIAKIDGAARGGGAELLLALDMRFTSPGSAFGFPEASLGILAAGGGTQRLPRLLGRSRALELLLGSEDLDPEQAERYGLVNRVLPEGQLDPWVERLAARIAALPSQVVALTKLATRTSTEVGTGYALEALALDLLKTAPASRQRMERFLAEGGQTRAGEDEFGRLLAKLDDGDPSR